MCMLLQRLAKKQALNVNKRVIIDYCCRLWLLNNGGGGGSRTRVPRAFTRGIYMLSH